MYLALCGHGGQRLSARCLESKHGTFLHVRHLHRHRPPQARITHYYPCPSGFPVANNSPFIHAPLQPISSHDNRTNPLVPLSSLPCPTPSRIAIAAAWHLRTLSAACYVPRRVESPWTREYLPYFVRRSKHSSTCMEDSDGGPICAPPALPLCRPAPARALAPRAAAHRPLRALQPVSSSPPPPLRPPVSTLPPSPLVDNSLQPIELRPLLTPRMHDGQ